MIEVFVKKIPCGDRSRSKTLQRVEIIDKCNHKKMPYYANYSVVYFTKEKVLQTRVDDHEISQGELALVKKAFERIYQLSMEIEEQK